ncbi:type 1 glutamine amidotransferase [Pseudonocardia acidicola]|uniref:Lipid II isoglutaminyl synthase (glutamine-hydrolyzing) subunit GatD n=1 Tax=Pseudonocardia acidicola TaxID=2724939 RepID=A0ABX1SJB7_9PSEU|nr:glutamine amidotransferase [Pseudonocardia acidicola]NMI01664.1 glutamine amidotransferase [Pseudonocardia acidicola]
MTVDSAVAIGLLLPDVLGTYSDAGNATVLAQRLRWRGIPADVHRVTARDTPPAGCDIYLLGGGEDIAQYYAASWLQRHRGLRHALDTRAHILAVCAGMQILGHTMTDATGHHHRGLGLLDLTTAPRSQRAVGQILTRCSLPGVGLLTGFENHRGATSLGAGAQPLGQVVAGIGNGAGPAAEGIVTDRVIATYLHGPVLARNPTLADYLLQQVIGYPLPALDLPDLPALRAHYLAATQRRTLLRRRR